MRLITPAGALAGAAGADVPAVISSPLLYFLPFLKGITSVRPATVVASALRAERSG